MKAIFQSMADRLVEQVDKDVSIMLPRTEPGNDRLVSVWFSAYGDRFGSIMAELFRQEFPKSYETRGEEDIRNFMHEFVWPRAEPHLRAYVVRGLATRWVARRYTDATYLGEPLHTEAGWSLPIRMRGRSGEFGQIVTDEEGHILTEKSTSWEELRGMLQRVA